MSFPTYAEYKESGVKWLGSIPSHWEVVQSRRLFRARRETAKEDDVMLTASQKYGMIPQSEFVEKEGRRVVEVIQGKENLIHVEPDDFVISMRSFQGGLEWCRYTGSTSFHYVPVTPIKNVVPSFFAHLLKSAPYISALRSTTNLIRDGQEIRYSNFVQAPLPLVPKQEQLAIASFLDRETTKIDALIAEQKHLIELLQEKRQAVISHAVTKGLNPNAPMKDSGVEWLGEVPEHWDVTRIKNIGRGVIGLTYSPSEITDEQNGIPVLRASNVQNGLLDWQDMVIVSRHIDPELIIKPGDILICARSGSRDLIGKNALISQEDINGPTTFGAFMTVLRCIDPLFLRWTLASTVFKAQSGAYMSTTINQLTQTTLMNTVIVLPPEKERRDICDFLESKARDIDCLSTEAGRSVLILQERRSSIISAAVTGQIDVRGLVEVEPGEQ